LPPATPRRPSLIMADIEGTDPISGAADETATRHQLTGLIGRSAPLPIWAHLDAMKDWLARARQAATQADQRGSAAAEWLLDNDYQIQRAILQIGEGLPKAFYAKLPGLAEDGLRRPRAHQVAQSLLLASHLQVSLSSAVEFVVRYQNKMPLSIAETWAIPTMLRIVCLEMIVTGFTQLFPQVAPPFALTNAMGKAPEEIRSAAHYISTSNDKDGIAAAIDAFLLPLVGGSS